MRALLAGLSIIFWLQGCCAIQRTEPPYPKDITGWRDSKEGTTKIRGSFVLKRGESTDNGKLSLRTEEEIFPAAAVAFLMSSASSASMCVQLISRMRGSSLSLMGITDADGKSPTNRRYRSSFVGTTRWGTTRGVNSNYLYSTGVNQSKSHHALLGSTLFYRRRDSLNFSQA